MAKEFVELGLAPRNDSPSEFVGQAPPDGPSKHLSHITLQVGGMDCGSCVARVEQPLLKLSGVARARANLASGQASVAYNSAKVNPDALVRAIEGAGYTAKALKSVREGQVEKLQLENAVSRGWLSRSVIGLLFLAMQFAAMWAPIDHQVSYWIQAGIAILAQLTLAFPFYRGALKRAMHFEANMDTLVAIGSTASVAAGIWGGHHESMGLHDGILIIVFVSFGL